MRFRCFVSTHPVLDIVLEYAGNGDLASYILKNQTVIDEPMAQHMAYQICSALEVSAVRLYASLVLIKRSTCISAVLYIVTSSQRCLPSTSVRDSAEVVLLEHSGDSDLSPNVQGGRLWPFYSCRAEEPV